MAKHLPGFNQGLVTEISHKVMFADSRSMVELADESVHLVVTSPPYWQLKDYGHDRQIGYGQSYEAYVEDLNRVWSECFRVLFEGCRLCVNVGDIFVRATSSESYRAIPINVEIVKYCLKAGFDYMGSIIWQKVTTMNSTGGATVMGSYPFPRNGVVRKDFEYILLFKKPGLGPKPTKKQKEASRMTSAEWNTFFSGHWSIPGVRQTDHPAVFPKEIPKRLIKMFSFVGETVLDPFLGSGTTSMTATDLGRNSFGYEVNPEFRPMIERKVGLEGRGLFDGEGKLEFEEISSRSQSTDDRKAIVLSRRVIPWIRPAVML